MKRPFYILSIFIGLAAATSGIASQKVLVVLSAASQIELQDGSHPEIGFYLNELTVPLRKLMRAGYEPVFVTPGGAVPHLDPGSDDVKYFGGDRTSYQEHKDLLTKLQLLVKDKSPVKNIAHFANEPFSDYAALFIPGGHAPMVDLIKDPSLGQILRRFHAQSKTTAMICHGPVSLISAINGADKYVEAMNHGNTSLAAKIAGDWIYKDYPMTVFSNAEDAEAEAKNLHGKMFFYPEDALRIAGGRVLEKTPWTSFIVQYKELLTGQNPQSDEEFGNRLIRILAARTKAVAQVD